MDGEVLELIMTLLPCTFDVLLAYLHLLVEYMLDITLQEIKEDLCDAHVTDVVRITNSDGGVQTPTSGLILTFFKSEKLDHPSKSKINQEMCSHPCRLRLEE
ncbi:hypothetical protein J6590_078737 [Homalodisca vitripennis]|nr:hypothetical protein J6590_078737 [Homalodisca vitripennis]